MNDDAEDRFDELDEREPPADEDEYLPADDEMEAGERDFELVDFATEAPLRSRLEHELEQEFLATRSWVVFVSRAWFAILGLNLGFVIWQMYALRGRMSWYMMLDLLSSLVVLVLLFVAAYLLTLFGQRCRSFLRSRSNLTLESARAAQKTFWKYCAIMSLILVALALFVIVLFAVVVMELAK